MNVFNSLTKGLHFNKKKNKASMEVFQMSKGPSVKKSLEQQRIPVDATATDTDSEFGNDGDEKTSKTKCGSKVGAYGAFDCEEDMNAFRNRLGIKVKGSTVPPLCSTFEEMDIDKSIKNSLLRNIEESRWKEPTAIQMQAVPAQLSGRDILASAPTGSGKTAAFLIPTLARLKSGKKQERVASGPQGLILAPTRELADQIYRDAMVLSVGRKLSVRVINKSSMTQGLASAGTQADSNPLMHAALLIGTPMRVLMLIRAKALDLSTVTMVVMDEVDKLFELDGADASAVAASKESGSQGVPRVSFLGQVDEILAACTHTGLQRALFSATVGPTVQELASAVLQNAIHVSVGRSDAGAAGIEQRLVFTGTEEGKLTALRNLVQDGLTPPVLVFTQSKDRASALHKELVFFGLTVDVIHADRTQQQRDEAVRAFRTGDVWLLICTDLLGRGLDLPAVRMVINFDLPHSAVSYIHRIGRTGRAGREGVAVTFFTEADLPNLRSIANVVKQSGCDVADWMLGIKPLKTKERKHLRLGGGPKRRAPTTDVPRGLQAESSSSSSSSSSSGQQQKHKNKKAKKLNDGKR